MGAEVRGHQKIVESDAADEVEPRSPDKARLEGQFILGVIQTEDGTPAVNPEKRIRIEIVDIQQKFELQVQRQPDLRKQADQRAVIVAVEHLGEKSIDERQGEYGIGVPREQYGLQNAEFKPIRRSERVRVNNQEILPTGGNVLQCKSVRVEQGQWIVPPEFVLGWMQYQRDR